MNIDIHHVELSMRGSEPVYVVTIEDPEFEGEPGMGSSVHVMPTDVFETRAAEYDIDVTKTGGWEQVLDLVFGEQLPGESVGGQLADPQFLLNAPTIAEAREAKLGKIRGVLGEGKLRGMPGTSKHRAILNDANAVTNSGEEDPLEFIKRTAPMSRDHIKVKQEFTRRRRNLIRAKRAGRHPIELGDLAEVDAQVKRDMAIPTRESAEDLAVRLLGEYPDESRESGLPPREGSPSKQL